MSTLETTTRLSWSINAMMHAKAKQLGVNVLPYQVNQVVEKAVAMIEKGADPQSAFFAIRDEAEALLTRQYSAETAISQMAAHIKYATENCMMAAVHVI